MFTVQEQMPYADGDVGQHFSGVESDQYLIQSQAEAYAEQAIPPSAVLDSNSHDGINVESTGEQLQQLEATQMLAISHFRSDIELQNVMANDQSISLQSGDYDDDQAISFQDLARGQ